MSAHLYLELTFRLLAALVLTGVIGLQRAVSGKAAGIRTHILVGLGSALMTIVSAYAFPGWPGGSRDPTRLAAQIVSGIGFIGGGMILKEGISVRGLTTAASLWAVAGVGIAAGSGLVPLAAIATVLILITLQVLGAVDRLIPQQQRTTWILSFSLADPAGLADFWKELRVHCSVIHLVGYDATGTGRSVRLVFELQAPRHFDIVHASSELTARGAIDPHWKADSYGEELA